MENMNWFAFATATLIPIIIGSIWYSPKGFGKAWMTSIGIKEGDKPKGHPAVVFGVTLIVSAFISFYLHHNIFAHHPEGEFETFGHGAFHATLTFLMIGMPIFLVIALFEGKSWKYIFINLGYWLVSFVLMCGIISVWR